MTHPRNPRLNLRTILSTEIVLEPLDIVLSKVGTALDLDKNQFFRSDVFDTMRRSCRYIHSTTGGGRDLAAIQCYFCDAGDDHPVLGSRGMSLVAQALLRQDFNAFNLAVLGDVGHRGTIPWA